MLSNKLSLFKFAVSIICWHCVFATGQRSRSAQHIDLTTTNGSKDNVKIAFGSCFGIWDFFSDMFDKIRDQPQSKTPQPAEPDMFVWLGDVAYIDSTEMLFRTMPEEYVRKRYADTLTAKGYDKIKNIVGIWDDHDYGQNDAGKEMVDRDRNRDIFLDFIKEPSDSDRRLQKGTAIFQDYYIKSDLHLIHLILLDNRFDYDKKTNDRLGSLQWQWLDDILEEGLEKNVTQTVIGAGIQMTMQRTGKLMETFQWPSKKHLYDLLKKHELSNVVLISGDVHFAQMHENKCRSLTGMKLVEITSSGLSHSQKDFIPFANQTAKSVCPSFFVSSDPYAEMNYGNVIVDKDGTVTLEVRNYWGQVVLGETLTQEDLKFDERTLRFSKNFCESKLGKQLWFLYFEYVIEWWLSMNLNTITWLAFVFPFLFSALASGGLALFKLFLRFCVSRQKSQS